MKSFNFLSLPALAALVIGCTAELEEQNAEIPQQEAIEETFSPEDGYVQGLTVVQFSDEMLALIESDLRAGSLRTKSGDLNQVLADLGASEISPVFPEEECPEEYRAREREFGLRNFYYVRHESQPLTKAGDALASLPGVISAEPQRLVAINDYFNDPKLKDQWHYINNAYPGIDVNCLPVWESFTTGDPSVIVCVIDEGVDLEHEDLVWNCLPGGPDGSRNFADGTYDVEPMSHGTHVAGTIAAVNNNGIGVSGIAGGDFKRNNHGVKIMSCQFFGTKRNGSAADGIRWGANHGAIISQNSWGYVADINDDGKISADELEYAKHMQIDAAMKSAVDYFIKYAGCDANGNQKPDSPMKGGIVIFAAGNDNIPYGAPANYEKILAVGAINESGKRASFSNYGDWVDICAPGTNIWSTLPGNKYGTAQGTSMACPHVSGVAALVVSYAGGKGFTNDMLWTKLVNGGKTGVVSAAGTPIGPLVDAYGAILYGDTGEPGPISSFSVDYQSNNVYLSWEVTPTSKGSASYAAMLYASKDKTALETMNPSNPGGGIVMASQLTSTNAVGDRVTGTISGLEFDTHYYVTISAYSYNNVFSAIAPIQEVTTGPNHPPFVTVDLDPIPTHKNYEVWTIPITVGDPDGHEVTVSYKSGNEADSLQPDAEHGGFLIAINGPKTAGGTYTGTVTVTDSYGLSSSASVTYTLLPNSEPVVVKPIENQIFSAPGQERSFLLTDIFHDEDGEPLALDIQVSDKSAFHAVSDGEHMIVTALTFGAATISVTATDARGAAAVMNFGALTREENVETSVYPSPVVDMLYISTGVEEKETAIAIYSASGSLVYQGKQPSSAFAPASVNMSAFAPGRYRVVFTYGDKEYKKTVVKK